MKGKDVILSNFLSRQTHDDSNLHDTIPISFNMHKKKIFNTDTFANNIKWSNTTRGPWCREDTRYEFIAQKTESNPAN